MQNGHTECLILKKAQHKYSIVLLLRPISGEQITHEATAKLLLSGGLGKTEKREKGK